jgi:hypothetical protein
MIVITIARLCLLAFLLCPLSGAQPAEKSAEESAEELVRRVVANELKAQEEDHSHWMFRLQSEGPDGATQVEEVVQTKTGELKRPIMINGRELTAQEQEQADQRIEQLIRNSAPLRKGTKEKK